MPDLMTAALAYQDAARAAWARYAEAHTAGDFETANREQDDVRRFVQAGSACREKLAEGARP